MSRERLDEVVRRIGRVILGKEEKVRLALACLLARGHLLIEDVPGVGKTTLANTLARVLGLDFRRIQFTSDLLPADIIGVSVFDAPKGVFVFHPGPVFTRVILADEINRATPKTQSALLEAMEERQVTVEGQTRPLPAPFFVIATQNPLRQIGTFPLPESQLDRFLMRLELGYPDREAERALLRGQDRREILDAIEPVMDAPELLDLQGRVRGVFVAEPLLDYIQALLERSRQSAAYRGGLSPRAGQYLLRAAQAWAMMEGREAVIPEDVQRLLPGVAGHRLRGRGELGEAPPEILVRELFDVPIP